MNGSIPSTSGMVKPAIAVGGENKPSLPFRTALTDRDHSCVTPTPPFSPSPQYRIDGRNAPEGF